jgi:hypothetical protein
MQSLPAHAKKSVPENQNLLPKNRTSTLAAYLGRERCAQINSSNFF